MITDSRHTRPHATHTRNTHLTIHGEGKSIEGECLVEALGHLQELLHVGLVDVELAWVDGWLVGGLVGWLVGRQVK